MVFLCPPLWAGRVSSGMILLLCISMLLPSRAFFVIPNSFSHHPVVLSTTTKRTLSQHSVVSQPQDREKEYSVHENREEEEEHSSSVSTASFPRPRSSKQQQKQHFEYAALSPGSYVRIQVGDVTLARKAWKKRRRSGSPLLVPCSVLDVDRKSMIRWNILYLLQKFGTSLNELLSLKSELLGYNNMQQSNAADIALSMTQIKKLYKTHLGASLSKHATVLGHASARDLLLGLFYPRVQEEYGVRLWVSSSPRREKDEDSNNTDDAKEEDDDDDENRPMWLIAPLSAVRARRMAAKAGLLQFTAPEQENHDVVKHDEDEKEVDLSRMHHTGMLRVRRQGDDDHDARQQQGRRRRRSRPHHQWLPLSAALRVSQRDLESGRIGEGSIHTAVMLSLDPLGDGGSPLLTLSLKQTRGQWLDRHKMKEAGRQHFSKMKQWNAMRLQEVRWKLEDLKAGDGPFLGTVVEISTKSEAAFVDCGVGRMGTTRARKGGELTRVLGMLQFDDLLHSTLGGNEAPSEPVVESRFSAMSEEEADLIESALLSEDDWDSEDFENVASVDDLFLVEEEETDSNVEVIEEEDYEFEGDEDVTHLVSTDSDGNMIYTDPVTGETTIIDHEDDEDHDDDTEEEDDEEDNPFAGLTPEERLVRLGEIFESNQGSRRRQDGAKRATANVSKTAVDDDTESFAPSFVKVGDEVVVYIRSVSKQSGRYTVTMDSSVKGRKAKDLKRENEVEKRLARLKAKLGGEVGYQKVLELKGTECIGDIKAGSKTGDWFYVQPRLDELPVGVAVCSDEVKDLSFSSHFSEGDTVRVRLDGIDEDRGQLAMTIIRVEES